MLLKLENTIFRCNQTFLNSHSYKKFKILISHSTSQWLHKVYQPQPQPPPPPTKPKNIMIKITVEEEKEAVATLKMVSGFGSGGY